MNKQDFIDMMIRTEGRIKSYRELIKTDKSVREDLKREVRLLKHLKAMYEYVELDGGLVALERAGKALA